MTWINIIGRKFPSFIKPFIKKTFFRLLPLRIRMGKDYWELKKFLEEAQWWEREKIESWQLERVQKIVKFAYEQTDGYHVLFNEAGVKPEDIQSLEDIKISSVYYQRIDPR